MPRVASLDALHRAVAEFGVTDPGLVIEPPALAAARRSLDSSGLLLLGEAHGVRENPLLIRALMLAFGLTSLALEWPEELTPVIRAYLAGKTLPDHPWLWGGDGRITAGHLAVLAERAAAGPLKLILFDGVTGADWSWSQRDEAMARRILAASPPGARTLAVAGNAHTPTSPIERASRWAPAWPSSGPPSGRSGSGTTPGITGTSSRANSPATRTRTYTYGFTSTTAASSWTCPWPRRQSYRSDRSQDRLPMRKHPHCGSDTALQLGAHGAESASTRPTPDLAGGPGYL